jgi:hypothetical protein
MVYEVVIEERREFVIIGEGKSVIEGQRDALDAYHRLIKSGELAPHTVRKPRVLTAERYGIQK